MKHYYPTGRRNHGRPSKILPDTWDRNGSTSGPTPWQIYDHDDENIKCPARNSSSQKVSLGFVMICKNFRINFILNLRTPRCSVTVRNESLTAILVPLISVIFIVGPVLSSCLLSNLHNKQNPVPTYNKNTVLWFSYSAVVNTAVYFIN
jgi:hypothetical protein